MITLHTSLLEIKEIKELITYKIEHTYLNKYIQKPVIDEGKIIALSIIVNNTSLPALTKKQYIITTMLVQIALDTHDLVPITNDDLEGEEEITTRQLTVLAGDYYSGLYYLLLAEIGDIDMIHVVATAIKEINEYKMKLYYKEVNSFDDYIAMVQKVDSLLIMRVAEFVNNAMINDIIGEILITHKLIQEKCNFPNQGQSAIINNWLSYAQNSTYPSILNRVESVIEQNTSQIEAFLSQPTLRISEFKTQLQYMLDELIYTNAIVAEEG